MSLTTFVDDPATRALATRLRGSEAYALLTAASGLAQQDAERQRLNAAIAAHARSFDEGERMYTAAASHGLAPEAPTEERIAAAVVAHCPAVADLAARHGLALRTALSLVLALASCPP